MIDELAVVPILHDVALRRAIQEGVKASWSWALTTSIRMRVLDLEGALEVRLRPLLTSVRNSWACDVTGCHYSVTLRITKPQQNPPIFHRLRLESLPNIKTPRSCSSMCYLATDPGVSKNMHRKSVSYRSGGLRMFWI